MVFIKTNNVNEDAFSICVCITKYVVSVALF